MQYAGMSSLMLVANPLSLLSPGAKSNHPGGGRKDFQPDLEFALRATPAEVPILPGRLKGLFLYHCHNLEHEDMGMMRNFLVQA